MTAAPALWHGALRVLPPCEPHAQAKCAHQACTQRVRAPVHMAWPRMPPMVTPTTSSDAASLPIGDPRHTLEAVTFSVRTMYYTVGRRTCTRGLPASSSLLSTFTWVSAAEPPPAAHPMVAICERSPHSARKVRVKDLRKICGRHRTAMRPLPAGIRGSDPCNAAEGLAITAIIAITHGLLGQQSGTAR
jgi:hypothetical protein